MRGFVSADWLIGMMIFIVFVSFAFAYYANVIREESSPLSISKEFIADEIADFIYINVYDIPVHYDSASAQSDAVLYFDYNWPNGERNTTRVYFGDDGDDNRSCIISNGRLYWQSDLSAGFNNFTVRYSDNNASKRCAGSFGTGGAIKAVPWPEEHTKMLSWSRIEEMNATDYESFRSEQGIDRGFRILFNISGANFTYGPPEPLMSDVFVVRRFGTVEETGELADLRIMVW